MSRSDDDRAWHRQVLDRLTWPRQALSDLQADVLTIRVAVLTIIPNRIKRLETLMAQDRDLLAVIAAGLAAIGPELDRILADNTRLRRENAELSGEAAMDEAGDVAAAQPVKDALDALVAKLAPVAPPEPTPIEDVPAVVEGAPEPSPVDNPGL